MTLEVFILSGVSLKLKISLLLSFLYGNVFELHDNVEIGCLENAAGLLPAVPGRYDASCPSPKALMQWLNIDLFRYSYRLPLI